MAAESDIMAALFARLATYTALPIAWPNSTFTKPANFRYLEPKFIPNSSDRIISGPLRQYGLMQINVHWNKLQGEIAPREAAEAVAALFPCDDRVGTDPRVRITNKPDIRDLIIDASAPDVMVPIIISWDCPA